MAHICRICLTETFAPNFFEITSDAKSSEIKIEVLLCIPEIDIHLFGRVFFCTTCIGALNACYIFKKKCLYTEERIQCYLKSRKNPKGVTILDVYKSTGCYTNIDCNSFLDDLSDLLDESLRGRVTNDDVSRVKQEDESSDVEIVYDSKIQNIEQTRITSTLPETENSIHIQQQTSVEINNSHVTQQQINSGIKNSISIQKASGGKRRKYAFEHLDNLLNDALSGNATSDKDVSGNEIEQEDETNDEFDSNVQNIAQARRTSTLPETENSFHIQQQANVEFNNSHVSQQKINYGIKNSISIQKASGGKRRRYSFQNLKNILNDVLNGNATSDKDVSGNEIEQEYETNDEFDDNFQNIEQARRTTLSETENSFHIQQQTNVEFNNSHVTQQKIHSGIKNPISIQKASGGKRRKYNFQNSNDLLNDTLRSNATSHENVSEVEIEQEDETSDVEIVHDSNFQNIKQVQRTENSIHIPQQTSVEVNNSHATQQKVNSDIKDSISMPNATGGKRRKYTSKKKTDAVNENSVVKIQKCRRCSFTTSEAAAFIQHRKEHPPTKMLRCDLCSFRTTSVEKLENHSASHVVLKMKECPNCDFKTLDKSVLEKHFAVRHSHKKVPQLKIKKNKSALTSKICPYTCHLCGFSSVQSIDLQNHLLALHQLESYTASINNKLTTEG